MPQKSKNPTFEQEKFPKFVNKQTFQFNYELLIAKMSIKI